MCEHCSVECWVFEYYHRKSLHCFMELEVGLVHFRRRVEVRSSGRRGRYGIGLAVWYFVSGLFLFNLYGRFREGSWMYLTTLYITLKLEEIKSEPNSITIETNNESERVLIWIEGSSFVKKQVQSRHSIFTKWLFVFFLFCIQSKTMEHASTLSSHHSH